VSIAAIIAKHRIVVCVGTGGVGKTTTAAAIALHGAVQGRHAMVLTIDPARRLAQSLGFDALVNQGEQIAPQHFAAAGIEVAGTLTAAMLDQKSAWDEFIARHASSGELRDTILRNEFYQHLSRSFAGSMEYMAVEELCRIDESNRYDLIVLDTPPTGHALDFLDAPRRLDDFLDRTVIAWFVKPYVTAGWAAWKTASRTVRFLMRRIEDATGITTLGQISEFFLSMESLFDGIAERSRKVHDLLASERTAFVLVAGPEEQVLGESELLTARMRSLGMPLKGVVMNRTHPLPEDGEACADLEQVRTLLHECGLADVPPLVVDWLWDTYRDACTVARTECLRREAFEQGLDADVARVAVPESLGDVHDLRALGEIARAIAAREAP
jgi:anion-transporting  ArsA/GET3 family ATPase